METTDGSVGDKLTSAAAKGDSKEVNSLLENGVQADAINKFGRTALQVRVTVPIFFTAHYTSIHEKQMRAAFLASYFFKQRPLDFVSVWSRRQ